VESPRQHVTNPLLLNEAHAVQLLERFIRDEILRTGLKRAVIGLSGGVDSALSTYLTARAIGAENVHVVLMPYRTSHPSSLSDAMTIVKDLELSHEVFDISSMADAFFTAHPTMENVRKGNVMARLRMITLYDRSSERGALVVGTSNKTESLLGYTTLYGDNASAINPLGDLYKTQVWQLSAALNIPSAILNKAPSADLWEGQTDESELGVRYREVDALLFYMVDFRESNEALVGRGFELSFVERIRKMVRRVQFKRRPPVIAKISSRTINVDFRYPRDWGS
jgi:NAD+ synthase